MKIGKKLLACAVVAGSLWPALCLAGQDPSMTDYTAYPVFIRESVKPNILIILDNSGSMNFMAYGYHQDARYHPDDFGAIVTARATGGSNVQLEDTETVFTGKVSVGDVLHNLDKRSKGTITGVEPNRLLLSAGMSDGALNSSGDRYWVEHNNLKRPVRLEEGYYGYFVPTARYKYQSNVFVRDDVGGDFSGNFLNWLTMRRVDVARKVLVGGLATARTGGGNQHLIGEDPAQSSRRFLKLISDPTGHSPYPNNHFYKILGGNFEVYRLDTGSFDFNKDFSYDGGGGDTWSLADYYFDYNSRGTYTVRMTVMSGSAKGPRDPTVTYCNKYFLYDPDQDFRAKVQVGDTFLMSDGSTGIVTAVPTSGQEVLNALPNDDVRFDMLKYDGRNDGYLAYFDRSSNPPPCQSYSNMSQCASGVPDLVTRLDPVAGHILIVSTTSGNGPYSPLTYEIRREMIATRVATYRIEVARDASQPDEAKDFVDGNIAGIIQKIGSRARFGLMFYNYDEGGKVVQYVGSNTTDLITRIENQSCETWTPLAESLYEAIRYFMQIEPYYYRNDFQRNNTWDPYYFNDLGRFVECSKSFILQITDGESTMDQSIPADLRDYDGDGRDPGSYPDNGSDYLDDVALWGHMDRSLRKPRDLRPDLPGVQDLTYYTVFAFGRGSRLLMDAARNGGFKDVNGDGLPEPPGGDPELIHLEWDKNRDGVPDTYFEAPTGLELEAKVYQAITDILKQAASGTAVSVLSTSEQGTGAVYQAFFRPVVTEGAEDIKWVGSVQCIWVDEKGNLRADADGDQALVLTKDPIIRYRFDVGTQKTYVDFYPDSDGDGVPDNEAPEKSVLLDELEGAVWEAGKQLALRSASNRRIFTFVDSNWNGVAEAGEVVDFETDALRDRKEYLQLMGTSLDSYDFLGAGEDTRLENLVRFIRGEDVPGLRNRKITVDGELKVWKLGDIVYSTPTVVVHPVEAYDRIYGDSTYAEFAKHWKDRKGTLYVGANDGMLHAFKAGTFLAGDDPDTQDVKEAGRFVGTDLGKEEWAYIPFNLLPHLKWLARQDYTHVYYVDLKPRAADVRIFPEDSSTHIKGWGTLLVGGMRFGGGPYPATVGSTERVFRSAYFILDVTDPDDPRVLAEFSHPEMGFTLSYPAITKVEDHWYLIVGSGPTPGATPPYNYEGKSDQRGRIFVLDLTKFMISNQIREGQELFVFRTDPLEDQGFMASPISVDLGLDYSADVIYVGETYWKANRWNGKMFRLKTSANTDPSTWELSVLYDAGTDKSITAGASAAIGFNNDLWVFFGTGKFYNDDDKADTRIQSLYGIRDICVEGGSCGAVSSSSILDVTGAIVKTDKTVTGISDVATFEELESKLRGVSPYYLGWELRLGAGERSLNKPSVIGGVVLYTTFTPSRDMCSIGGDGGLYGLYFLTGTAHYKPILGKNEATGESLRSMDLGKGMPASLGIHVGAESGAVGFVQTSTGSIERVAIELPLIHKSATLYWRECGAQGETCP